MSTWTKTTDKLPDIGRPVVGLHAWDDGSFSLYVVWREPGGWGSDSKNVKRKPDYWFEIPAFIGEVQ